MATYLGRCALARAAQLALDDLFGPGAGRRVSDRDIEEYVENLALVAALGLVDEPDPFGAACDRLDELADDDVAALVSSYWAPVSDRVVRAAHISDSLGGAARLSRTRL